MRNYLVDLNADVTKALWGWGKWEGTGLVDFQNDDIDTEGLLEVIRPFLERAYSDGFKQARRVKERNPYHDYGDRSVNDPVVTDV